GWGGHRRARRPRGRQRRGLPPRARRQAVIETVRIELPPGPELGDRLGRLSPAIAFAATGSILVLFAAAASAPTPLYVVYQKEWGFPTSTLTIVFAVYVFALIGSLLVLGGLSDHVGRRPVLAAAIAL